jgi:hypothetical protein
MRVALAAVVEQDLSLQPALAEVPENCTTLMPGSTYDEYGPRCGHDTHLHSCL